MFLQTKLYFIIQFLENESLVLTKKVVPPFVSVLGFKGNVNYDTHQYLRILLTFFTPTQ